MSAYISATLRGLVYDRAKGCCEYCLISEVAAFAPHEVDHVIAQKHNGATEESNLALSCTLCNKHKGTDLASIDSETGDITPLFHPRRDRWHDHFRLSEAEFIPLTPIGRVTVRLLQMNRPDRVRERQLLLKGEMLSLPVGDGI